MSQLLSPVASCPLHEMGSSKPTILGSGSIMDTGMSSESFLRSRSVDSDEELFKSLPKAHIVQHLETTKGRKHFHLRRIVCACPCWLSYSSVSVIIQGRKQLLWLLGC